MFKAKSTNFATASAAIVLALTLSACGGSDEAAQVDDQTLVTEVEEAPQATGGFDAPVVTQTRFHTHFPHLLVSHRESSLPECFQDKPMSAST